MTIHEEFLAPKKMSQEVEPGATVLYLGGHSPRLQGVLQTGMTGTAIIAAPVMAALLKVRFPGIGAVQIDNDAITLPPILEVRD